MIYLTPCFSWCGFCSKGSFIDLLAWRESRCIQTHWNWLTESHLWIELQVYSTINHVMPFQYQSFIWVFLKRWKEFIPTQPWIFFFPKKKIYSLNLIRRWIIWNLNLYFTTTSHRMLFMKYLIQKGFHYVYKYRSNTYQL